MTAAEADERALAAEVAASVLDRPVTSCTPLPGLGSVNQIFVAHAADTELIVRLRSDPAAAAEYRKERWCIATAVARGVPGPQVLAVGQRGRTGFMVQRRLPGRNGAFVSDAQAVWHALGRFARSIHGIAPAGFGETLADEHAGRFAAPLHPGFDGTWPGFVRYNIASLGPSDPLRALGVLTAATSDRVAAAFDALLTRPFRFGLIHGDLAARNTLVDDAGSVALLDWGSAAVHIVPHWDLVQLRLTELEQGSPTAAQLAAFRAGYGMDDAAWRALEDEVAALLVLSTCDTLRWALEHKREYVDRYAVIARRALAALPASR